jgi:S-adenosylmethionine hydrolase
VTLVSVLTDFGLADTYVGQVKAAILSVCAGATIVDLTHAVPPQDIFAGAFLLWSAVEPFPPGSVHVAVVDPGVGSPRRAIALRSHRGDLFVGPDNGLLIPAAKRLGGIGHSVELIRPEFWRLQTSLTFHGRDIFGPVAGHLAEGVPLEDLGSPFTDPITLTIPEPDGLSGEVIHVDTYGNLVTNLPGTNLPDQFTLRVADHEVPCAAYYAAVEPGALLALVGSTGLLEISAREASAAALTAARRGTRVELRL